MDLIISDYEYREDNTQRKVTIGFVSDRAIIAYTPEIREVSVNICLISLVLGISQKEVSDMIYDIRRNNSGDIEIREFSIYINNSYVIAKINGLKYYNVELLKFLAIRYSRPFLVTFPSLSSNTRNRLKEVEELFQTISNQSNKT